MCCLQEVRWSGLGARILGMKGRRYKLWWSRKGDRVCGVGVMVKEELCENLLVVRRVSGRVMTVVVFEEDVLRLMCGYAPQGGGSLEEKQSFYDELKCEWDMHSAGDSVMCLDDLMDMLVGILMALMEGMVLFRGIWKEECYSFVWRINYVCQIHGLGWRKRGR